MRPLPGFTSRRLLGAALTAAVFLVDLVTPLGVNVPLLYLIPLLLAFFSERVRARCRPGPGRLTGVPAPSAANPDRQYPMPATALAARRSAIGRCRIVAASARSTVTHQTGR